MSNISRRSIFAACGLGVAATAVPVAFAAAVIAAPLEPLPLHNPEGLVIGSDDWNRLIERVNELSKR